LSNKVFVNNRISNWLVLHPTSYKARLFELVLLKRYPKENKKRTKREPTLFMGLNKNGKDKILVLRRKKLQ
jgi:hypothetical protein